MGHLGCSSLYALIFVVKFQVHCMKHKKLIEAGHKLLHKSQVWQVHVVFLNVSYLHCQFNPACDQLQEISWHIAKLNITVSVHLLWAKCTIFRRSYLFKTTFFQSKVELKSLTIHLLTLSVWSKTRLNISAYPKTTGWKNSQLYVTIHIIN